MMSEIFKKGVKRALGVFVALVFLAHMAYSTDQVRPIACVQYLQISIGYDGYVKLSPEMILADTFANYDPFEVVVLDRGTDTIWCSDVGSSVMVMVTDTRDGNSCWSTLTVEDKLPPRISCINDTLPCYISPDSVDYSIYATAYDNCDDSVEVAYFDIVDRRFCDPAFVSVVTLEWTATDDQGLQSSCTSTIYFAKIDPSEAMFPSDTMVYCPFMDTLLVGEPLIDGRPINILCELFAFYRDDTLPGRCSGEYTIERTWNVMDICTNITETDVQYITVLDTVAPILICPDTIVVNTEDTSCTGVYVIPEVIAYDECGEDSLIVTTFELPNGTLLMTGDTVILDTGFHTFICTATDDCGNADSCTHVVHVVDMVAPTLFCLPDFDVYLDSSGYAEICIEDFDHNNHYFDNCGIDSVTISKMEERCDTALNPAPRFCLNFCCDEVTETVMIVITVTDIAGNKNFCMINTRVYDTIVPRIVESPGDTTISCTVDYRDTSLTGGRVIVEDNCFDSTLLKIIDSVDLDACMEGTVTRYFIACDPMGNADTAIQIITVVNGYVFRPGLIVWPMDTCVETCPADSLPETLGSFPEIIGDSCGVVMVTYMDSVISDPDSACLFLARTWTVATQCGGGFMMDSIQMITIKNYRPPILSGPPLDTTIALGPDSCFVRVTLPVLKATDCSTGLTVANDCTGGGATVDSIFTVGRKVVTYLATDACGNVSSYQTVIEVVDNMGPVMSCPTDTTIDCNTPTDTATLGRPIATDNCGEMGGVVITFSDEETAGDCTQEKTIERTFTATDSSGNTNTCVQVIVVQDTMGPVMSCPADVSLSCEDPMDSGTLGRATAIDQCQGPIISVLERDSTVAGRCAFEYTVYRIFSAIDDCGNMASCIQTIAVSDTTPPDIVCPPNIQVDCGDLTDPGMTGTPSATDNCSTLGIVITRRDSIVPGTGQTLRTILREWTATDDCGNSASCVQTIVVRDIVVPSIVCPLDTTISCSDQIDTLSQYGSPTVSDNCSGVILTYDTIYDLNVCNVGTITRVFYATDSVGNQSSCEQVITLELADTLRESDITWPDSMITVDACTGVLPDSVGVPLLDSTAASCFLVSFDYLDSIEYTCMTGVCTTLTRKWTLVDSCQLDTLGGGVFTFTQTIQVIDTTQPIISDIMHDTAYIHPDSACDVYFHIVADAFDCSGIRSITNNSRYGVDTLRNASGRYPRGLTPITFIAEDSCCNKDTQLIFIVVLDTIPPSLTCRDIEKRIIGETGTGTGMVEVCVSELVESFVDNCDNPLDLDISFDPNDLTDTCIVFNCDSMMGMRTLRRNLTLYIRDGSGNVSTCASMVTINDPFLVCSGMIIGGQVVSMFGPGIEDVTLEIEQMDMTTRTDENGGYHFDELYGGRSYTIDLEKEEEDPLNGISTVDVLMIHRHLLGVREFDHPHQWIAADVNGDASLEISDMVTLIRLIIGKIAYLPVPAWQFVIEDYAFNHYDHPSSQREAFGYTIDSLSSHMNLRFVGIKSGDLNGDAQVTHLSDNQPRTRKEAKVSFRQTSAQTSGEEGVAFVDIQMKGAIQALSLSLSVHSQVIVDDVQVLDAPQINVQFVQTGDLLHLVWVDAANERLSEDLPVVIYYHVASDFRGEAFELIEGDQSYAVNDALENWALKGYDPVSLLDDVMILEQNKPNPFSTNTLIEVYMAMGEDVHFEIFDASGKLVLQRVISTETGWNHIMVDGDDLHGAGMYVYKVTCSGGSEVRRMIFMTE